MDLSNVPRRPFANDFITGETGAETETEIGFEGVLARDAGRDSGVDGRVPNHERLGFGTDITDGEGEFVREWDGGDTGAEAGYDFVAACAPSIEVVSVFSGPGGDCADNTCGLGEGDGEGRAGGASGERDAQEIGVSALVSTIGVITPK